MNKKIKTKVLVTGGVGFIGSNLVDELINLDYEVHILDNLSAGNRSYLNKKAKFHQKDVTKLEQIEPLFRGIKYVFHMAALPSVQFSIEKPLESNEANVKGTLNVLIACKKAKVKRLIYSASSSAYGDQKVMPLKEDFIAMPKSPYALQKYIGELYCRLFSDVYGLETVCLRYFNVYGNRNNSEGPYASVIAKFIKQKEKGEIITITGSGKQTRDFTNVKDVVRANILAMQSNKVGKGEVINIGTGKNVSINEIAKIIGGKVKHIDARLEPKNSLADISRAKRLLGWSPKIGLEEGIRELLN